MKRKSTFLIIAIQMLFYSITVTGQGRYTNNQSNHKNIQEPNKIVQIKEHNIFQHDQQQHLSASRAIADTIYFEDFDMGVTECSFIDLWSESFWHLSPTGSYSGNSYWCGIEGNGGWPPGHCVWIPAINGSGWSSMAGGRSVLSVRLAMAGRT